MSKDVYVVHFQSKALEQLASDAKKQHVHVRALTGRDCISQLFEFEIHLVCTGTKGVDVEQLMTKPAAIVFYRRISGKQDELREEARLNGMVSHVTDRLVAHGKHAEYLLTFVPRFWRATLTTVNDVFLDMTVPEIIEKKLKENTGLEKGKDVEFRLQEKYPKREFVVQYQESDFNFICRLAEHVGIFFFFEHRDGRDILVFGDKNANFTKVKAKGEEKKSVHLQLGGERTEVFQLEADYRQVTTVFDTRDYNYCKPDLDVKGQAKLDCTGAGIVDEYGANVKTPEEAQHIAGVRAQEMCCRSLVYRGAGDVPGFQAGAGVKIEGHPRGDVDALLVEVTHHIVQPVTGMALKDEQPYENEFRAIPSATAYRPARITPKPIMPGAVTGVVEAAQETKVGAVDEQGRYRVTFLFDAVTGRDKGKASRAIRMSQPTASADRGFHIPLKPGTEVTICFVNGDPDRPIISGAVPNPRTGSPVTSSNAQESKMRVNTSGLTLSDDQGSEGQGPLTTLNTDGQTHQLKVGNAATETGFLQETAANITKRFGEISTSMGKVSTAWQDYLGSLTAKDIIIIAGIPNPWSRVKKIQEVAKAVGEVLKAGMSGAAAWQKEWENIYQANVKAIEKKIAAARERAVKNSGKTYPKDATTVKDLKTGQERRETQAEFDARVAKDEQASKPAVQQELAKLEQQKRQQEEWAELQKDSVKVSDEIAKGAGKAASTVADLAGALEKKSETVKKWSDASKQATEAVKHANVASLKTAQNTAKLLTNLSTGRTQPTVGQFTGVAHILGSTNSTGIWGGENTLLAAGKEAVLVSRGEVVVAAKKTAHLKALDWVEMASRQGIKQTAKKIIDVYSPKQVQIVAHGSEKTIPKSGFSMLLTGEHSVKLHSTDKDIESLAKKNLVMTAETERVLIDAKKMEFAAHGKEAAYLGAGGGSGFGLVAEGKVLKLGKVSSADNLKNAAVESDCAITMKDKAIKTTVSSSFFSVGSKALAGKGSSGVGIQSGGKMNLKASGKVTVKGSKVMLG